MEYLSFMRILFLTERYPPDRGGLAHSSERIASGIAKRGIEIHVLYVDGAVGAGDLESIMQDRIIIHRVGPFPEEDRTSMTICRVIDLLNTQRPFDALMGMYLVKAGYIAALEAKLLGIPSLVMVRGNDVDREIFRPENQPYVLGALQMASAIGCVSRELIAKCRALTDRNGIHYTPNSVDNSVFSPGAPDTQLKKILGLSELVIGFSGELRFKKGMSHILAAAEQIIERFPSVKFLLLGGVRVDDEKEYKQLLEDAPMLKELVVEVPYISGKPSELCKYYRLMDVIFMPSIWEGMPNACLEAFACGVPAVGSTAGGLRDLIEPGITGYSFAPGDFQGAMQALNDFLSLPADRRRAMGALAREKILIEYSPDMETDRILEIIKEII